MDILRATVDVYLVLKNGTNDQILQMLENELIDLSGRYDVAGDTVYHAILRNKRLTEEKIIAISRILRKRGVDPAALNRHAKSPLYLAIEKRMRDVGDYFINYNPRLPGNYYALTRFFVEDENKHFWRFPRQFYPDYSRDLLNASEKIESESAKFFKWLIAIEYHGNSEDDDFELTMLLRLAVDCNLKHILPVLLEHANERIISNIEQDSLLQLYLKKHALAKRLLDNHHTRYWYSGYTSRYATSILEILLNKGAVVDLSIVRLCAEEIRNVAIVKKMIDRLPVGGDEVIFASILNTLMNYADDSSPELYEQTLSALVSKGANVNASDSSGRVPLQVALASKNPRAILWLTSRDLDFTTLTDEQLNSKDESGSSALHHAVKFGDATLVKRLIERGARVDCRDKSMRTPLHYAALDSEVPEILETLLRNGANADARDVDGVRPLFLAIYTADYRYVDEEQLCTLFRRGTPTLQVDQVDSHETFIWKKSIIANMLLCHQAQPNALRDLEIQGRLDKIFVTKLLTFGLALDDSPFCRSLFERSTDSLLIRHSIKLRAAKLPCYDGYQAIGDDYQRYYEVCLKEVEKMKQTFVVGGLSYYRFLHLDLNGRSIRIVNEGLRGRFEFSNVNKQFPEYARVICASYIEAFTREKLLEPAKRAWLELTEIALPDICLEGILGFLSNVDLIDMVYGHFHESKIWNREVEIETSEKLKLNRYI